jgi:hypothetical protein
MKIQTMASADGNLYQIIYAVPDWETICQMENIDTQNEPFLDVEKTLIKYNCDRVFRHDNFLVFVRLIEEAKLIEDNLETTETNTTLPSS